MRHAARIRVPKALRAPSTTASRQGRRHSVALRPHIQTFNELRFVGRLNREQNSVCAWPPKKTGGHFW